MNTTNTPSFVPSIIGKSGPSRTQARRFRVLLVLATVAIIIAATGTTTLYSAKQASVIGGGNVVAVSPLNMQRWQVQHAHCNGGTSTGFQQFEAGPAKPPLAGGGYRFTIGSDGDSLEAIRYPGLNLVRLDQLTALSYSAYIRDFNNGQTPYLMLNIDVDGNATLDDQLFFEPAYQNSQDSPPNPQVPPIKGQRQTWDALHGGWWSANDVCGAGPGANVKSLSQYLSCQPNARIINTPTGQGGFLIAAGCGGSATVSFDGSIDNVKIGFAAPIGSPKSKPADGGSEITFAFGLAACTLTCPADITQVNDPGECGAIVNYPAPQAGEGCGTVNCTPASGLFFPIGTTTVTCTNQEISLRPSGAAQNSEICLPNTITESTSQTITPQNSFSCNDGIAHSDNSYWRAFALTNFSIANNLDVQSVDIGIQSATSAMGQPLTLRLYTNTGGAFPGGTRNLIATADYTIPDQALTIVNLPISAIVPAGSELVVEVFTPNANGRDTLFFIGSNAEVETGPSYVSAPDCNITDPTPTADIGFPDMHIVMNVNGCEEVTSCAFTVTVNETQPLSIMCPANITQNTDPNQCSAVVTYPAPTIIANCPASAVCAPPSGSAFPKGATTVTCAVSGSSGVSCSFTVTVNDAQPPSITCPANQTAVTNQNVCPSPACQVVNFPAPVASDNCPGVLVVCNPPGGSCFPVGVTTVTCTATDTSGNTATCSFTVTTFDVALQDDSNPAIILLWNSITGQYRFCCNGTTYTGVGKATRQGCVYTLQTPTATDRRILGRHDKAVHAGSGSLQAPPGAIRCTITDRNTLNDTLLPACQ